MRPHAVVKAVVKTVKAVVQTCPSEMASRSSEAACASPVFVGGDDVTCVMRQG